MKVRYLVSVLAAALTLSTSTWLAGCDNAGPTTGAAVKPAELPAPRSARFVKLEEVTEWNGKAWASMAEFNLVDATGALVDRTGWTATADSAGASESPRLAIDGDPKSLWHSAWEGTGPAPPPPHWFAVALGRPVMLSGFRYLPRQDKVGNGTIAQYRFYLSNDGVEWGQPVSSGDFAAMSGPTVEKIVVFAKATENHAPAAVVPAAQSTAMGQLVALQISASDADGDRLTYAAEGLPNGLAIGAETGAITGTPIAPGTFSVRVTVSDNKGPATSVTFPWAVSPPTVATDAAAPADGQMRFVKLEAVSEVNGKPWSSVAELNLVGPDGTNLPRTGWTASADSSDTSDRPMNAIDGTPLSIWHTQWDGASPPPPHSLIVDMGHTSKLSAFRYLPRQDTLSNGMIARFRFYASVDGINWGQPLAEGDFSSIGAPHAEKTVKLK